MLFHSVISAAVTSGAISYTTFVVCCALGLSAMTGVVVHAKKRGCPVPRACVVVFWLLAICAWMAVDAGIRWLVR